MERVSKAGKATMSSSSAESDQRSRNSAGRLGSALSKTISVGPTDSSCSRMVAASRAGSTPTQGTPSEVSAAVTATTRTLFPATTTARFSSSWSRLRVSQERNEVISSTN